MYQQTLHKTVVVQYFTLPIGVFHDVQTRVRIDLGCEYGGLYYLDDGTLHSYLATISPFDTPL